MLSLSPTNSESDVFEVKDALAKMGEIYKRVDPAASEILIGYRRDIDRGRRCLHSLGRYRTCRSSFAE